MIVKTFSVYISSILILIDLAVALHSDGVCSFVETYTDAVTFLQSYKTTVTRTRKCGVFSTRICYDYPERISYKTAVQHVLKTRTKYQCCQGYSKTNNQCLPVCNEPCINGLCTEPDKCTCNTGYEAFNSTVCSPICEQACISGICTKPDTCTCLDGYELSIEFDYICNPICSSGCLNGSCVAPNLCKCDEGYDFNDETKECHPICDDECVNSDCTSPNVCTCHVGFLQTNSSHCEIICENCTNGYCEEANVCLCDIGYHINNENGTCVQNECVPNVMEDNCENGYCSDDGVCVCESGYERNESAICAPICSLECINSYCSEPEVCQCHDGFDLILTNGTDDGGSNCTNCTNFTSWNVCIAICDGCQNGTCIEGICNCFDGYVQHPTNKGTCITPGELINLKVIQSGSDSAYLGIVITMVFVVLVVAVSAVGVVAFKKYARKSSYKCNSDVIYYKDEDNNVF